MSDKKRKQQGEVYSIFKKQKTASGSDGEVLMDEATSKQRLADLKASLDFTDVTTEEQITARFQSISTALLHEFQLVVRRENASDMLLEILEAELYLQIGGCHEDPFTHGSEEQKVSGRWYFHRAPRFSQDSRRSATSLTEYRTGSRKGLDLTVGGPPQTPSSPSKGDPVQTDGHLLRGGVLLRSVRQVSTGKVTSGPSLLVDLILSASRASGIQELVDTKWGKDTSAFLSELADKRPFCLFLKPIAITSKASKIYYSPRIGLELSHPGITSAKMLPLHPRIQFLPKKYRFFTHPELLIANGRAQTFLAAFESLQEDSPTTSTSVSKNASLSRNISRITGTKEVTAARYLADFTAGREGGVDLIDTFIGSKGKGASSSPATYLKMMGALSSLDIK